MIFGSRKTCATIKSSISPNRIRSPSRSPRSKKEFNTFNTRPDSPTSYPNVRYIIVLSINILYINVKYVLRYLHGSISTGDSLFYGKWKQTLNNIIRTGISNDVIIPLYYKRDLIIKITYNYN